MSLRLLKITIRVFPVLGAAACASASPYQGLTATDLYELGQSEFEAENWDDAAEALDFLLLRVSDASFEYTADARYMLARAYFNDEQYLTAESEFIRFLERHPRDERRAEAALSVCRCYAALSPIPERDQTYTKRAESVCGNVYQDYAGIDDEIASEAQEIVNEMRGKLGEKEYENGMFYFRNEYWLSAIDYFQMVLDDFGDTAWAPKAIARMIEAYDEVGYDTEVDLWRETLLNSYPDSPEAEALMGDVGSDPAVVGG
jgi:outer membrane protein assembly factor BamD